MRTADLKKIIDVLLTGVKKKNSKTKLENHSSSELPPTGYLTLKKKINPRLIRALSRRKKMPSPHPTLKCANSSVSPF